LEADQEDDDDVYDKTSCWYEHSVESKTTAINDAETHIQQLTSEIDADTAASARLTTEIAQKEAELEADKASIASATQIRKKQYDEFTQEEKDLVESITAVKAALTVLAKHQSLVQVPAGSMSTIRKMLKDQLDRHGGALRQTLTLPQRKLVALLVGQAAVKNETNATKVTNVTNVTNVTSVTNAPSVTNATSVTKYDPQSGEIYGILQEMLEGFEEDLSLGRQEETDAKAQHSNLTKAKQDQIRVSSAQLQSKEAELALTDSRLAENQQDLADTTKTLGKDREALAALQQGSNLTQAEYEQRKARRSDEILAIAHALEILSADDAHDTFSRTFNPSFMQRSSAPQRTSSSSRRGRAAAVLASVASKSHSTSLSALAVEVQALDFTEVFASIDGMIGQLEQEQSDEVKEKDDCIQSLHVNEKEIAQKEHERSRYDVEIGDLQATIDRLGVEITELEEQNNKSFAIVQRAGEHRQAQHEEFLSTAANHNETLGLLGEAKSILEGYYGLTVAPAALPQVPPTGSPFDTYKDHGAAPTVIALIDQIIDDTEKMYADSVRAEEQQQKAYEREVNSASDSIQANDDSITHKRVALTDANDDLVHAEGARNSVDSNLNALAQTESQVHASCDFLLKNFDVTQGARAEEIQALRDAKAILNGAVFDS